MTAGMIRAPTIIPLRTPIPGKSKNAIDTETRIELKSETQDVDVYFTLNGSRPEPFSSGGQRNTFKYREPIILPSGRRCVKALAVTQDGSRESNVVTKTFEVELVKSDGKSQTTNVDGFGFIEELRDRSATSDALTADARKISRDYIRKLLDTNGDGISRGEAWSTAGQLKPRQSARFTENRLNKDMNNVSLTTSSKAKEKLLETSSTPNFSRIEAGGGALENATQAMRILRETDFTKCIYCLAPRPNDPFARFCNSCGKAVPPLPQTRLPPPESGQMGACVYCRSMVPFNLPTCLVCEAPMAPQNQPQASQKLRELLLCSRCGTGNPPHLKSCLTCEEKLPDVNGINSSSFKVNLPPNNHINAISSNSALLLGCTKCGRLNSPEARFCDWCGTKPSSALTQLMCSSCGCHNAPMATYCAQCAALLLPPSRLEPQPNQPSRWMPATAIPWKTTTKPIQFEAATQTVGLFYPSTTEIRQKEQDEQDKRRIENEMKDRAPLLTVISPGRGFWRKQVEHIIAHLKGHAANNAEFRARIGEPRIGKLLSAEVHEDGYELNLSLTYALKDYRDPYVGQPLGTSHFLSTYSKERRASLDSIKSDSTNSTASGLRAGITQSRSSSVGPKSKKKLNSKRSSRPKKRLTNDGLPRKPLQDKTLLREVSKVGEGRPSEVQNLIEDQSADPNTVNKEGVSALILAVRNSFKDVIPVLVNCGADVNWRGPDNGNTALHEAVKKGFGAEELIDVLLGCKANVKQKNDRNETAYDLAVKLKNESAMKKLAPCFNQTTLDKLLKPQDGK